jgi:hypothetical protein
MYAVQAVIPIGTTATVTQLNVAFANLVATAPSTTVDIYMFVYTDKNGGPGSEIVGLAGQATLNGGPENTSVNVSGPTLQPGVYWITINGTWGNGTTAYAAAANPCAVMQWSSPSSFPSTWTNCSSCSCSSITLGFTAQF